MQTERDFRAKAVRSKECRGIVATVLTNPAIFSEICK
jgi:hypothetical protein